MIDIEAEFSTGTFSWPVIDILDMAKPLWEVQTSQGKDVAEVYETPNENHHYEIRAVGQPSEIDRIHDKDTSKETIRNNASEFLESINHPDSDSDLLVYPV